MAFLGPLGPILGAVGTGVSAFGTLAQGVAANRAAQQDALNAEAEGKEELAAATRAAEEKRRDTLKNLSTAQALAAASGGGAGTDAPTIVKLMGATAAQGEYNAEAEIWKGRTLQQGFIQKAAMRRAEGRASLLGGALDGFGTLADAMGRLGKK